MYDAVYKPFTTLMFWICFFAAPTVLAWFGVSLHIGWVTYITTATSLYSAVQAWSERIQYESLKLTLVTWKIITKAKGGPFISWHSMSDPRYEWYVYADAMTRLQPY
jgi:hypothetical protein